MAAPTAPGAAPSPASGALPPGPQPPVYGPPPAGPPPPGYPPQPYSQPYYPGPYGAPPAPIVPLDAHSHTGFFLRMSIGGGYMANASTLEGPTYRGTVDARGGAIALELAIGGALSPGLILAGTYTVHSVGDAKLTNDTRTSAAGRYRPEHDPGLTMLAAMLDVYPNHKGGFHLGGSLGFATLRVRADEDPLASDNGQNGFGIAPHVGYEWWVSNYWGLGVLGRFVFARTEGDYADGKEKDTVTGGAILFSATYN